MFPTVMFARDVFASIMFWPGSSGPPRTIVYHLAATVAINAANVDITAAKVTPR